MLDFYVKACLKSLIFMKGLQWTLAGDCESVLLRRNNTVQIHIF